MLNGDKFNKTELEDKGLNVEGYINYLSKYISGHHTTTLKFFEPNTGTVLDREVTGRQEQEEIKRKLINSINEINQQENRRLQEIGGSKKKETSLNYDFEMDINKLISKHSELASMVSNLSSLMFDVIHSKTKVDIEVKSQDHFIDYQTKGLS